MQTLSHLFWKLISLFEMVEPETNGNQMFG